MLDKEADDAAGEHGGDGAAQQGAQPQARQVAALTLSAALRPMSRCMKRLSQAMASRAA
ncbi:MAG: hypothetical protein HYW07_05765 [Candidatus Latescibacteria bacterium]|nr:hypothetical protein [Candidatus Latescibacterota bacterium]